MPKSPKAPKPKANDKNAELISTLKKAWQQFQDDEGWTHISLAGNFIKRSQPDFDPRTYGATKITDIITRLNNDFETTKFKGKGTNMIIAYKPLSR